MCLRDQGIDNNDGGVIRVRQARGISDENRGVGRELGIDDASEELEITEEAIEDLGATTECTALK